MSDTIFMGITVEDVQQRINATFERAKEQEGVDLKAEMTSLKAAIHENPSICQHLLPEDIGKLVHMIKGFHHSAREESKISPTERKRKEKAAVKEMLSKPMSQDQLQGLLDEL